MTAVTPPNGCRWCGILEWEHGSRFDSLHPRGVHTYVAPSNQLRLVRMKFRRWHQSTR